MTVQTTDSRRQILPSSLLLAVLATTASLSGCYVVPLDSRPYPHGPTTVVAVPAAPTLPVTLSARLYPANDLASAAGVVTAIVTNDLNGRGHFSTNILGENFGGEATRVPGSNREGLANALRQPGWLHQLPLHHEQRRFRHGHLHLVQRRCFLHAHRRLGTSLGPSRSQRAAPFGYWPDKD